MKVPGFVGGAYKLRSSILDCQRCVNLYAELDENGSGKDGNAAALVSTPGLERLNLTIGPSPIRGLYLASNGVLYVCSGGVVYRVASDWTVAVLGTILSSAGRVSFADNGTTMMMVDGSYGYVLNMTTGVTTQITDPDFWPADTVVYLDGYYVFNRKGTGKFFVGSLSTDSSPNGTDFNILDYGKAGADPDNIKAIISLNQKLWLFGENTIELFYNSGNASGIPFDRMNGAVMSVGCVSAASISVLNNTAYWLGSDDSGSGVVYAADGYTPVRISTHAIEYALQQAGSLSNCTSYAYQQEGHYFYVLNVPAMRAGDPSTTFVYDASTKLWHERTFTNTATGAQERHVADCYVFAYNTHVVGDYRYGAIYKLSLDKYTDDGATITRLRSSPHSASDLKQVFYNEFALDMEIGIGLDGGETPGNDPQVMLQWSNNGGKTWSNERWKTIGALGTFKTRVRWLRLGRARDRVWRIVITDPVKVSIIGASFDLAVGNT